MEGAEGEGPASYCSSAARVAADAWPDIFSASPHQTLYPGVGSRTGPEKPSPQRHPPLPSPPECSREQGAGAAAEGKPERPTPVPPGHRPRGYPDSGTRTLIGFVSLGPRHRPCISSIALQACELRANLTKAMPLDSLVCLSRTTQISWISPKGEKRSLSTDSGVYLLITRKMRLLGGSSRLSTPRRKPPPLAQLPASSMVLQPGAGLRAPSPSILFASAVPTTAAVANPAVASPELCFRKT